MTVRFVSLHVYETKIPFRFSFKHALAERNCAHNLILKLETECGHYGFGEVLPRSYLTGESIESSWQDIEHRWWPAIRGRDCVSPRDFLRETYLEADAERRIASYSGIDLAVFDAWARAMSIPGWRMLGQAKPGAAQAMTLPLGGGGPRSVKWLARLGRLLGFCEFKLKTGMKRDSERIAIARKIIGASSDLRVDANCAFTLPGAMEAAKTLREYKVSSVEQPLAAADYDGLARVAREGGVDVMADESICTLKDAKALLAAKAAQIWNLRLAKVGGISGFLTMAELAQSSGIEIHHGTLVGETQVLTAAARACLGAVPVRHLEYGYPGLLLQKKIFRGGPGGNFGIARPLSNKSGFGIELNERQLEEVLVNKKTFLIK